MAFRRTLLLGGAAVLAAVVLTQSIADPAYAATRRHHHRSHHRTHHHHHRTHHVHHVLGKSGTYAAKPKPKIGPVAPRRTVAPKPTPRPTPTIGVSLPADTSTVGLAPALSSDAAMEQTAGLAAVEPSPVSPAVESAVADPTPAADPTSAPPAAAPSGWTQTYAEDFDSGTLPSNFGPYDGQPGGNDGGWWDRSHVVVRDGSLVLQGYRENGKFVTGGVMAWGAAESTYGKYEIRFRMTKAKGVKYALLLWPKSDRWPVDGEIDFAEDGGGNRSGTTATVHYGTDNQQIQRSVDADFSTWQTVGVEWTPGKLVYTLNGLPWGTVSTPDVPSGGMDLAIQSEALSCDDGCPDASTPANVDLEVDWIKVFKQAV